MKINWSFIEPVRDQATRLRGDYSAQSAIVKLAEQQADIEHLREENARLAALASQASLEASQLREALEELDPHYSDGLCARIDAVLVKGGEDE